MLRKIWPPLTVILLLVACWASEANQFHPSPRPLKRDPTPQTSDLTAAQLLAKYHAARGGEEKLEAIRSVKMTGTWSNSQSIPSPHSFNHAGSGSPSPSPVTLLIAPGRYLRRIEQGSGVPMIRAVDGQTTWEISPQKGILKPLPMVEEDAVRYRHLADPQGPLVNFQAKGNKVEVVGKMPWKRSQVYKLKVTFRDGGVDYLYLDAKSFLPVRMVTKLYLPRPDKEVDIEFLYQDFRHVDGVKWPFTEKANAPEANLEQTISWSKIEVNQPLDASAFKAPKG